MSEDANGKMSEQDAVLVQAYAKTRKSLIAKLENWEDQRTWDEFYQTYWRLIFAVFFGGFALAGRESVSVDS